MGREEFGRMQACRCLLVLWVALWGASVQCEEMGRGYKMTSIGELVDGSGIVGHLDLIEGTEIYGPDIEELRVIARYEGDNIHVHITDATTPRWEVPLSVIPRPNVKSLVSSAPTSPVEGSQDDGQWREVPAPDSSHPMVLKYHVDPFGFSVTRRSDNEELFNTIPEKLESVDGSGSKENSFNSLVFKDQYIEISTRIPEDAYLYGIGEMSRPDGMRLVPNRTYTLWATDIASYFVDIPLYSTYPFIMDLREGAITHGLLLMNSNGMDIRYENRSITYKIIGGILDFYIFPGTSPLAVVDQLTALVGRPAAFPYWSLGLHQARFGYKNVEELEHVTREYARAKLPMESMSADIDHMNNFMDFTLNPETYPEEKLRPYVDRLQRNHQKFIMILDPNVKIDETYKTYVRASALDVFMLNGTGESRYIAQVWPGPSNIPDFLHPNAEKWWTQEIADFHGVIPFDGLWLDMNEPANFCSGPNCYYGPTIVCSEILWKCCMICDNNASSLDKWNNPPYAINNFGDKRPLYIKTVSLDALHHDGSKSYDTHNIYGMTEAIATHNALQKVTSKRPFVLSRSCFLGSGSYAAHWTGDNGALWSELSGSVLSIMSSGMFGMPMVGADICGFNMHTTEELCRRWIQVGAFYPFARSHSDSAATNQELFLWDSVSKVASHVLHWRYRMLPFWYTLMYEAHTTGAPYVRPLFFTFPLDKQTWTINHQFMIGDKVLVSPVLEENTTSVHAYFPRGVWYDLFGVTPTIQAGEGSLWEDLPSPQDAINVHVRGGSIIPLQDFAMTTTEVRATPFTLLVAFERAPETSVLHPPSSILCGDADREYAFGHLYVDDGVQVNMTLTSGRASYIKFEATRIGSSYTLKSSVNESAYANNLGFVVGTVKVLGMHSAPLAVHVNGRAASHVEVKLHSTSPAVELVGLNHPLGTEMELVWSTSLPVSGQLMSC
ncbi:hypothetical protein KC19_7G055400 [Ceratodon purpureus]|uniref:Maltase n=1 Tax=Ceratodon purpureus TaxID=3225 RepID=A0A8T0H2K9_CERPU|nr:hypothetical protein KC19_7G055400 [Ceratodon purpureus]